eukprot:2107999-Prymnesium_polylepis.1
MPFVRAQLSLGHSKGVNVASTQAQPTGAGCGAPAVNHELDDVVNVRMPEPRVHGQVGHARRQPRLQPGGVDDVKIWPNAVHGLLII